MIDLSPLARRLAGTPLADWANTLQAQLDKKMEKGHGDLERWQSALDALPKIQPSEVDLLNGLNSTPIATTPPRADAHGVDGPVAVAQGPFDLFGVHVDTEWRSDWKWSRVAPHWTSRANASSMSAAATATTCGACSAPAPTA
jgi:tRNA (mo5U34)-methyltransferase